jgi:hypothetical protein
MKLIGETGHTLQHGRPIIFQIRTLGSEQSNKIKKQAKAQMGKNGRRFSKIVSSETSAPPPPPCYRFSPNFPHVVCHRPNRRAKLNFRSERGRHPQRWERQRQGKILARLKIGRYERYEAGISWRQKASSANR